MPKTKKHKLRRWTCPECGDGIHAPSKLRRIDTRRWCLPCCERLGEMVERECAAQQKGAERAKKKAAKKAAKKRAKISAKKAATKEGKKTFWKVEHLDVRKEFRRICAHPHARKVLTKNFGRLPRLYLSRNNRVRAYRGRAHTSNGEIRMWLSRDLDVTRFVMVACHEIAHIIDDEERNQGRGFGHGDAWWSHFQELIREAYEVTVDGAIGGDKYTKDRAILKALEGCEWLKNGEPPPRKPSKPRGAKAMTFQCESMYEPEPDDEDDNGSSRLREFFEF